MTYERCARVFDRPTARARIKKGLFRDEIRFGVRLEDFLSAGASKRDVKRMVREKWISEHFIMEHGSHFKIFVWMGDECSQTAPIKRWISVALAFLGRRLRLR